MEEWRIFKPFYFRKSLLLGTLSQRWTSSSGEKVGSEQIGLETLRATGEALEWRT